jgi:lysozyme
MTMRRPVRTSLALAAAAAAAFVACAPASDDARDRIGVDVEPWTATKVCPKDKVEGIDVSNVNGTIDWKQVKSSGRAFAFMKATQGTGYVASSFAPNWSGSKAAGVIRSPYHFFDPTVDGHAQASHFLSIVGKLEATDLPAMLDLECPDGDSACLGYAGGSGVAPGATITTRVLDWLGDVEKATGKKPLIYSFPAYFDGAGVDVSKLKDYPLVIATLSSCASVPNDWTTMAFWQYSWTGTVPGITGSVDLDVFNGTLAQLLAFANPDAPPVGNLDLADCDAVAGWAQDPDTPTSPLGVDLYFDATAGAGTAWQRVTASLAHGSQGNHGFSVSTPFGALDGKAHVVHAYAIDSSGAGPNPELPNSPKTITCAAPNLPAGVKRHIVDMTSMTAWTWGTLDVLHVDPSKLASVVAGPDWPATPSFVHGDATGDTQVWALDLGGSVKRKVASDAVLASWRIDKSKVTALAESKLQATTQGPDWRASPFVVQATGAPEIWVIDDDPNKPPEPTVTVATPKGVSEPTQANASTNQSGGCDLGARGSSNGASAFAAWALVAAAAAIHRRRR